MKKYIFTFLFLIPSLVCYSQLYSIREKVDKFNDVVYSHNEKTIIKTHFFSNDSTITFETKGSDPVTYYVRSTTLEGSRTNEINLVRNLYGCEEWYLANTVNLKDTIDMPSDIRMEILLEYTNPKNMVLITHRTISSYSFKRHSSGEFPYETDLWWIEFIDGSRLIYKRE